MKFCRRKLVLVLVFPPHYSWCMWWQHEEANWFDGCAVVMRAWWWKNQTNKQTVKIVAAGPDNGRSGGVCNGPTVSLSSDVSLFIWRYNFAHGGNFRANNIWKWVLLFWRENKSFLFVESIRQQTKPIPSIHILVSLTWIRQIYHDTQRTRLLGG